MKQKIILQENCNKFKKIDFEMDNNKVHLAIYKTSQRSGRILAKNATRLYYSIVIGVELVYTEDIYTIRHDHLYSLAGAESSVSLLSPLTSSAAALRVALITGISCAVGASSILLVLS
jgi:hypothetical protein